MSDHDQQSDDRRNTERRLAVLESHYARLSSKVDLLAAGQQHQQDLFTQRFTNLDTLLKQLGDQMTIVRDMLTDPDKNVIARLLGKDVRDNAQEIATVSHEIRDLREKIAQAEGALAVWKWISGGGLAAGLLALCYGFLKVRGLVP